MLIAKHICNSHSPTLKPKIAKELVKPTQEEETTKRQQRLIRNAGNSCKTEKYE